MRILITGGAGFIGSHLVKHFVDLGHEVVIADRFTYAGKARRLGEYLTRVPFLIGDLAQGDLPYRCTEVAPDVVIHTAAETHVDRAIMDPTSFLIANPLGTSKLLDAFAKSPKPKPRFIVYSTDEVYGASQEPSELRYELSSRYNPSNAYSASKVAVEAVCNAFRVTHKLPITIVRPCNVYGRGQHPEKAVPKWVGQIMAGKPATIYNDGRGFRDWMHTLDHCRAIQAIIEKRPRYLVYNLARGDFRTDLDVFSAVCRVLGVDASYTLTPGRPGHDRGYAMDGYGLRCLGWEPQVSFEDGLADLVKHIQYEPNFWAHDLVRAV